MIRQVLSSLLLLAFMVSCGKDSVSSFVKKIDVSADAQTGETIVGINYAVDLGEGSFPAIELPVYNSSAVVGTLRLSPGIGGEEDVIGLSFNLDTGLSVEVTEDPKLPNGLNIPVTVDGAKNYVLTIGKSSRLYVSEKNGSYIVGITLSVAEFSSLGDNIGSANIFPHFSVSGVEGVAGIYTHADDDKNGLAIFSATSFNKSSFASSSLRTRAQRPSRWRMYRFSKAFKRIKRDGVEFTID
jgi:hypothetical protein